MKRSIPSLVVLSLLAGLAGCDMLGIESPEKLAAVRDNEGRAVGGACRHAGRAIEDCYTLNRKADKAAVFAGWRDMNDYMRENKIEPVPPVIAPQQTQQVASKSPEPDAKPESKKDGGKPAKPEKGHGS
jgi:hypothetical protein